MKATVPDRDGTLSEWRPLRLAAPVTPPVLAEILDGGQAFRWHQSGGEWLGIFGSQVVRLRAMESGAVEWGTPGSRVTETAAALEDYFDVRHDATELADALPWRSDAHLARCLAAFPGLRILRQPFGETLLAFLCSATKQIVQIKQMLALLAARHGAPVATIAGAPVHRLPSWEELARVPESALRACLLGFRARFIHETARFLARSPGWLEATERMPYAEAKARLRELPGVGEKIADCVLLFGAGRLEAFPVDVWILRTLANRYDLRGWKPAPLAQFGRTHFGPRAGLAQQYLFAFERACARGRVA